MDWATFLKNASCGMRMPPRMRMPPSFHDLDDDLRSKSHPQQKKHTACISYLADNLSCLVLSSIIFFVGETIEQVKCDIQCEVDGTRDMNHWEQQTEQGKAVYFS